MVINIFDIMRNTTVKIVISLWALIISACATENTHNNAEKAHQLYVEAHQLYIDGDYENALNEINTAIRLEQDSAIYYINRVFISLNTNRYKQVIEDADAMYKLDKNKKWLHVHYFKSLAELKLGLYEDALADIDFFIKNYEDAGEVKGELAIGYIHRGIILYALDDYKKAKESYEYAIKVNNGEESIESRALVGLANMTESPKEALSLINRSIELYNEYDFAYGSRAELLIKQGHIPEAYDDLKKALSLSHNDAQLNYRMALLLRDYMMKGEEAQLYFDKAKEYSPR